MEQGINYKEKSKLIALFKKHPQGLSTADIASLSGLSLPIVREEAPKLAHEYRGRIQVSERGELLWSFPQGFKSIYRGFGARFKRFSRSLGRFLLKTGKILFKFWILMNLIGYFVLFICLALASVLALTLASTAGKGNQQSSRRGNSFFGFYLINRIINLSIRIWFYSDLTRSIQDPYYQKRKKEARRPLHQGVFDFVFGPENPNADLIGQQDRAFAEFISGNGGLTSLGEYMAFAQLDAQTAGENLLRYCAMYEGQADLLDDGSLLYRFPSLLERTEFRQGRIQSPQELPYVFSTNSKKLNRTFGIINGINVLFGSYFLWQHAQLPGLESPGLSSVLYIVSHNLFSSFTSMPETFLFFGLGIVPLVFSLLFYAIPLGRNVYIKRKNKEIEWQKNRGRLFTQFWEQGRNAQPLEDSGKDSALLERELSALTAHSEVHSEVLPSGNVQWQLLGFEREARALVDQRSRVQEAGIGNIVFDSQAETE